MNIVAKNNAINWNYIEHTLMD
ncbi:hypothetical protein [Clostridium botulinum]